MQLKHIFSFFLLVTVLAACKKDNNTPEADVFYAVSISGYDVTFTNTTTGAVSYKWDFGDSTTSTEASPVHTYPGKGKYVPTLYATTKEGRVTEASTVVYIAKSSPVKLDDSTLSDWDNVTTSETISGAGETYFKKSKIDYDANYIYFYFEMNSNKNNGDIFDFYLDTDNDATTGLLTGTFPDGGYDVLLEGGVLANWFDVYNHSGAQDAFSFQPTGVAEFYTVGTVVQDGTTLKFEMRLVRSKIKGLAATKAFRVGIQTTKSDWSATLGNMPNANQSSILVNFE
ncbi:PKD domain-containing protein [Chitinophaga oryziterrae]|uniref:PKD domain-containing protein n=1 Tax=Chitinophaga oryziterrae TaxID=1031224 RepID=A0A6N8J5J8_9BACT|nr:PKD domain-containing protein [Chitinophaga oryziterrae]MVT39489.1 PKD domain-containing protein [Chitinophaga oryziterrae]